AHVREHALVRLAALNLSDAVAVHVDERAVGAAGRGVALQRIAGARAKAGAVAARMQRGVVADVHEAVELVHAAVGRRVAHARLAPASALGVRPAALTRRALGDGARGIADATAAQAFVAGDLAAEGAGDVVAAA